MSRTPLQLAENELTLLERLDAEADKDEFDAAAYRDRREKLVKARARVRQLREG